MNSRKGRKGPYPSGCSGERESHHLELLPAGTGRHCQADCHQPSCHLLPMALLPLPALGWVGHRAELRGSQGMLGYPQAAERMLGSFGAAHGGSVTRVAKGEARGCFLLLPGPTCPAGGSNLHLIVIRQRAPKWEVNAELQIDVDSVYFNYSLNRGDKGFLAPGVIRFVFIDSPGCHYLERNERVLSVAPICTPCPGCQPWQRGGTAHPAYTRAVWGTGML